MAERKRHVLALFDVDGTLTVPRREIMPEMVEFLDKLRGRISTGVVGGSDMAKQVEQLGPRTFELFDYNFAENGLVAYRGGAPFASSSLRDFLGNDKIKRLVNWVLRYLSELDIPVKRGTFIEYRTGMINISPIGRNCTHEERNEFEKFDEVHQIRNKMVAAMKAEFADYGLTYSIGGQISFDVFPAGWDKTFCLQFLPESEFTEVHFFGDKTDLGGNDHEIFTHPRTVGHSVKGPDHTRQLCEELFLS